MQGYILFRLVAPTGTETDFTWLEEVVVSDVKSGLTPLICIANVHSSLFHTQSVTKLQVCTTNSLMCVSRLKALVLNSRIFLGTMIPLYAIQRLCRQAYLPYTLYIHYNTK